MTVTPDSYTQYAEIHESPRFSSWLRERARDEWERMIDHRFVTEIASNDIDRPVYEEYLLQEYAFVETSASITGYAVGKAPTMSEKKQLVDGLVGLVSDQEDYFEDTFSALGVAEERWRDPELLPATRQFQDLMFRAGTSGGYAEALAPMLAAEWLYATWCREAAETVDANSAHGDWVLLHTDAEFVEHAEWLRNELDRLGPSLPPYREEEVAYLFRRALEMESKFHTGPYELLKE